MVCVCRCVVGLCRAPGLLLARVPAMTSLLHHPVMGGGGGRLIFPEAQRAVRVQPDALGCLSLSFCTAPWD